MRKQLYSDIYDDSVWLISLVENLLAVSRIEDGTMQLHRKLELMDDIVSEALLHIDRRSSEYVIQSEPSPETLLVDVDGRLIVQVRAPRSGSAASGKTTMSELLSPTMVPASLIRKSHIYLLCFTAEARK